MPSNSLRRALRARRSVKDVPGQSVKDVMRLNTKTAKGRPPRIALYYHRVVIFNTRISNLRDSKPNAKHAPPATSEACGDTPNGIIHDTLTVGCNTVDNGCGYTYAKQQWVWCNGTMSVVIGTVGDLVVHDNAISVGGSFTSIKGKVIKP